MKGTAMGSPERKPLYTVLAVTDEQLYDEDHRPVPGRRVLWQMVDGAKFTEDFPAAKFSMQAVAKVLDERSMELAKVLTLEGEHVTTDEAGRPIAPS